MMSEKRRLHPAAIFFTLVKTFKELIFTIGIWFFTLNEFGLTFFVIGICVIILVVLLFNVLSWYCYTYRVEEEELRVEYGILIRKKRYISKNRIQSIDLTQSIIHRLFKLVKVNIETAGSGTGAEASLKAVRLSVGEELREELKLVHKENPQMGGVTNEAEPKQPSQKITIKRLFLAGTTSGSIGVIFIIISALASDFSDYIPDDFYDNTVQTIISFGIMISAILSIVWLLLLWLVGIAGTMIKYGHFTISKNQDELLITRGLLEKKQTTIPLRRIQAVEVNESILRQPLGFVTLHAVIAGGSVEKGEEASTILFPIMKRSEVDDFLNRFLPGYVSKRNDLIGPPKQAKLFYVFRSSIVLLLAIIAIACLIPQFFWVPILVLFICFYVGLLRFKDAGFRMDGKQLTLRYRVFSRTTVILSHKRIQSFQRKQHVFQQKASVATVEASIVSTSDAGKHYKIKDLAIDDVLNLADWYSYREYF